MQPGPPSGPGQWQPPGAPPLAPQWQPQHPPTGAPQWPPTAPQNPPPYGFPPPPPAPQRSLLWLWFGLGGLAVLLVIGLVGVALFGKGGLAASHGGRYRAADDVCHLPEVAALGTTKTAPLPEKTTISGRPYVSCTLIVALSGKYQSASVSFSASIEKSADAAQASYHGYLGMAGRNVTMTNVPGLGTKASWYTSGGEIELIAYDDNLVFHLSWRADSASGMPPADLMTRLANVGVAVLNACRRPDAKGGPASSLSPLPTLASPSAPKLAFHKVDDLCKVTPFDKVGTVAPNTAKPRTDDVTDLYLMDCGVQLTPRSMMDSTQLQVTATVDTTGRDMSRAFQTEQQIAGGKAVPVAGLGTAAFYQQQFISGPRLVLYQSNLELSIDYLTIDQAGIPKDIEDRLKNLALGVMDALSK